MKPDKLPSPITPSFLLIPHSVKELEKNELLIHQSTGSTEKIYQLMDILKCIPHTCMEVEKEEEREREREKMRMNRGRKEFSYLMKMLFIWIRVRNNRNTQ